MTSDATPQETPPSSSSLPLLSRLSAMMFLQYFVQRYYLLTASG